MGPLTSSCGNRFFSLPCSARSLTAPSSSSFGRSRRLRGDRPNEVSRSSGDAIGWFTDQHPPHLGTESREASAGGFVPHVEARGQAATTFSPCRPALKGPNTLYAVIACEL